MEIKGADESETWWKLNWRTMCECITSGCQIYREQLEMGRDDV